jgi:dienelactone hydrolase
MRFSISLLCALGFLNTLPAEEIVEKGSFRFFPTDAQEQVPEPYQLGERTLDYEMSLKYRLASSKVTVYRLRYPTALESPHAENNTVHAEYYLPDGDGPFPATVVLDVTGGDQMLSRSMSTYLARKKIACLFVQMAYYGPRRPPGSRLRLLTPDIEHSLRAVRQTVLDLRYASSWLASRKEVNAGQLGIVGTSLGSFLGSLTAEMEPRFRNVVVLLGGGGLVDAYYDHPKAKDLRQLYEALGGTKETLAKIISPVDPLTYANNLRGRRLLIMAGKRDTIVPPQMAQRLWEASGKQQLLWFDCDHYEAVLYLPRALELIEKHLIEDTSE